MPADDYTLSYEGVPEGQRILDDDDMRLDYGFTPKRVLDYDRWLTAHDARVRAEAGAQAWRMAAIRSAPLLEAAWDEGNAMGLDGWTGPGRGEDPDDHAIQRRRRTVDHLADELAARADTITQEDTP